MGSFRATNGNGMKVSWEMTAAFGLLMRMGWKFHGNGSSVMVTNENGMRVPWEWE